MSKIKIEREGGSRNWIAVERRWITLGLNTVNTTNLSHRALDAARRGARVLFLVLLAHALGVVAAQAQKVPVVEKTLANGMRVLMVERHDEPSVAGGWVAHVGASNERPGITGIAHLFEHMMFKGTETIGTKDYQKDLEILAEQEKIRDEMRKEEAKMRAEFRHGDIDDLMKPENKTPRWR